MFSKGSITNPKPSLEMNLSNQNQDNFAIEDTVREMAANLSQPDKFSKIFCEAAQTQIPIADVLKKVIKAQLMTDHETIEHLKKVLREVHKEDWSWYLTKLGSTGFMIIGGVIGSVLTVIILTVLHLQAFR